MTAADADTLRNVMGEIFARLANEPHDTIPGLRRRYYYRGAFVLLEYLSARGLAANVERLRRRGEHGHADKLAAAWNDHGGAP